jgi:hypothetical protein
LRYKKFRPLDARACRGNSNNLKLLFSEMLGSSANEKNLANLSEDLVSRESAETTRSVKSDATNAVGLGDESEAEALDIETILSQLLADPSLVQYQTRHQQDLIDSIVSYFRCHWSAGQQRYILHVPFYPHFSEIPQVAATIFDDSVGRVRVTDRQKFGARIEVLLEHPVSQPQQVLVEVLASAPFAFDSHS